jgi:hypothetical protein
MSNLEKLKAIFGAATQGKWDALGRFHSIGFGIKGSMVPALKSSG